MRARGRTVLGRIARGRIALAVACGAAALLGARAGAAEAPRVGAEAPRVGAVDGVSITVSDADRAAAFFAEVLGFERVSEAELAGDAIERLQGVFAARLRVVRMRLGREGLELVEYLAPRGRAFPEDTRGNDRWFQHVAIVVSDMDRAYARLRRHRVAHASSGPQRLPDWNPNAGGIRAFYFRDPDGHFLELIQFPPGKGDPRWQQAAGRLFLGIDHTAIVVADTEASLRFYRDVLGLRKAGESENWGTEQEHLNGVFGARLRITGLRAPQGPGVELLEYLAPRDGRGRPLDARASDLLHWQTEMQARELPELAEALLAADARFVSPGAVDFDPPALGFRRALLVADPDGHAVRIRESE
jgi:catechol 2,3-dioxygenase-like lactoylglutathione lyase family enzyme